MKKLIIAIAGLAAASAIAQEQPRPDWKQPRPDWDKAQPVTAVTVARTDQAGVFKVSAVVTDQVSNQVLASPLLLVKADQEAKVEVGKAGGTLYRLSVKVDAAGKTATYQSTLSHAGQHRAEQTGQVDVAAGA